MKIEAEIQDRIRFLLTEEFGQRVEEATKRLPHKCNHNYRHPLDPRKQIEGVPNAYYNRVSRAEELPVIQSIGLCMLDAEKPEDWAGTICEDPIDAQRCPYFDSVDTKEVVWDKFQVQIKDLQWVQANMPEVYGLLWALGSKKIPDLPWWKRLWYRFLTIRPDPLIKTYTDEELLLPPA